MLSNLLYALPEISIIFGIIHLTVLYILSYESPKVYSKTARLWLLVSLFCIIIFYDKTYNSLYFENTTYTMLSKFLIIFFSYIMLIVSPFWFSSENKIGYKYLIYIFLSIVTSSLLISSINLVSLIISYSYLSYIDYKLLYLSNQEQAKRHIKVLLFVLFLMVIGFFAIYQINQHLTDFTSIEQLITNSTNNLKVYVSMVLLLVPFLYSLGLAPFHLEKEDNIGKSILPVSHYFSVVMPIVYWMTLIKLNESIFSSYSNYLSFSFVVIGIFSIVIGAIGANSRINLHRIYAHGTIYHFGVIMILLSFFDKETSFSAFIYLFCYLITLNGLYIVFYNLKSRGEFLSSQISLSGLAKTRPSTTRALLICIFSLLGFPPFIGFIREFSFINELLTHKSYILLITILLFFLILSKSYLEIIKTAYFEQKIKTYDTENKIILFTTIIGVFLIIIISFNPFQIIEKLKDMFYVIYL